MFILIPDESQGVAELPALPIERAFRPQINRPCWRVCRQVRAQGAIHLDRFDIADRDRFEFELPAVGAETRAGAIREIVAVDRDVTVARFHSADPRRAWD